MACQDVVSGDDGAVGSGIRKTDGDAGWVVAPLRLRAIAAVVDFLVITGLGIAAVQAAVFLGSGWRVEVGADLVSAATFLVGWGYFAGMEVGFEGRTVGKMGTGLRVVASGGGVGVEPVWVSARYLLKAVQVLFGSGLLFGVVVFDPRRRGLHDHLTGTWVVRDSPMESSVAVPRAGSGELGGGC